MADSRDPTVSNTTSGSELPTMLPANILDEAPVPTPPIGLGLLRDLPLEIVFTIFEKLEKADFLTLSLSTSQLHHLLAAYFKHEFAADNLTMYREDLGILESISVNTKKVQPAIIRFTCCTWERKESKDNNSQKIQEYSKSLTIYKRHVDETLDNTKDLTNSIAIFFGQEDPQIQVIIAKWIHAKFNVAGLSLCFACQRWMYFRGHDGKFMPYSKWLNLNLP